MRCLFTVAARSKFEVGSKTEWDILRAELERQKLSGARRDLEQKRSDDETKLKVLMNVDAFDPPAQISTAKAGPLNSGEVTPLHLREEDLQTRLFAKQSGSITGTRQGHRCAIRV
jgi:outer membrane protein TolC